MFENELLDSFSRVPAWVVPALYLPMATGLVAFGWAEGVPVGRLLAQVAGGWLVWTLMEYWLHRTVFHWIPDTSWGPSFHFYLHGVHHQWYQDKLRLVMPPAASLSVSVVVFSFLWGLSRILASTFDPSWCYGGFAGIVVGYTVYDCTHYYIHHFKPRTRVGLALRAHHNKHHHNEQFKDRKFGVSTTLWDHVFRTY